ncbi:MAG: hypothetical protein QOE75_1787 [Solirubrobacterales bacterium]|jgi:hypothetical protein|nr:hypothetical protein [Solirubrobacterales bacterium]
MQRLRPTIALAALCALVAFVTGCGGSDEDPSRPAPAATEFPSAKGKTIEEVLTKTGATPAELVIAPAGQVFELGENRYSFGVFTPGHKQIEDADAALYFAKDKTSPVQGPLPARVSSLETKPAYRANGSEGPGEAKTVYVVPKVDFDRSGPWLAVAMLKGPDGLQASWMPSPVVDRFPGVLEVGEKAPVIHTPTADDVGGDLAQIDTRIPPDQMHAVDFADVVGREPVVITFATPAFCESRVCGPTVDVVQEVADRYKGEADFIHMEVWKDNDPTTKKIRPQLRAFGLPTEPWTFLIDKDGVVRDRIEGAISVSELEEAMKTILPG